MITAIKTATVSAAIAAVALFGGTPVALAATSPHISTVSCGQDEQSGLRHDEHRAQGRERHDRHRTEGKARHEAHQVVRRHDPHLGRDGRYLHDMHGHKAHQCSQGEESGKHAKGGHRKAAKTEETGMRHDRHKVEGKTRHEEHKARHDVKRMEHIL